MDLKRYQHDPAGFMRALSIPTARGVKRFGDIEAEHQRCWIDALAPSLLALVRGEVPLATRFFLGGTKGSGKDLLLAMALLFVLTYSRRALTIQIAAGDLEQASETKKEMRDIVRLVPELDRLLEFRESAIVNPSTESRADVLTNDDAGSHGARVDLLIINELSHIANESYVLTLLDNASKLPNNMTIVCTNAGFRPSWAWNLRELARQSERWFFNEFCKAAPWIGEAELAEAERRNPPSRFARLWRGVWVDGAGDGLPGDVISDAVTLDGPSEPERGWCYVGGVDLGTTNDASAVCVVGRHVGFTERHVKPQRRLFGPMAVLADLNLLDDMLATTTQATYTHHQGSGRFKLASVDYWKATPGTRLDLSAVEARILELHKLYRLSALAIDPWQAELLSSRLRRQGVNIQLTPFTPNNLQSMAGTLLELFNERQVDLFDHEQLLSDLRSVRIIERSYGARLLFAHDESGHGDVGQSLILALNLAKQIPITSGAATINRQLVYN